MATFNEASPICRGKNLSWETVLLFFNNMPREAMPKTQFNSLVESRINSWTQTHSQIARQLAFYYEENGICYPRFTQETSYMELFAYMQNWARKYFIPNPYAPSLKDYTPTCIYSFVVKSLQDGVTDFHEILDSMFQVKLSSHDKVSVYLTNFTDILIDNNFVSLNERLNHFESVLHPAEEYATNPKKYYDYFTMPKDDVSDSQKRIPVKRIFQQIFFGAPGTSKSTTIKRLVGDAVQHRITFHPDTDYSNFVGCYKPTKEDGSNEITYAFVEQTFIKAYVDAWKKLVDESDEHKEVYLIIEEINRGNCAQIFGDLFQLLDRDDKGYSDYTIEPDSDLQRYLTKAFLGTSLPEDIKSGKVMQLPPNLYIWATMNTSDQSLFPIDSAFKRRWEWKYLPIKDDHKDHIIRVDGNHAYDWWKFLEAINTRIEKLTELEDKQLGYWFAKPNHGKEISVERFVSKVIFYLWNDVFKDYGNDGNSPFVIKLADDKKEKLKFTSFFDPEGNALPDQVAKFIEGLGVEANTGAATPTTTVERAPETAPEDVAPVEKTPANVNTDQSAPTLAFDDNSDEDDNNDDGEGLFNSLYNR